MRYLTIQYVRKPNGQMDESIAVCKRLRDRDIQMNSVVVDFRDRRVIKASMGGTSIPKDFDRIVGFYHQHYKATIDRLLMENGLQKVELETKNETDTAAPAGVDQQPGTGSVA